MPEEPFRTIEKLLASHEPEDLLQGLTLAKAEVSKAGDVDCRHLCEMMLPLFYIDPLDHPEHVSVIKEAIAVTASLGATIIPVLIQNLEAGDVKAQMAIAQALGRMGTAAVDPLIREYQSACPDPSCRAFLLYALGKVKSSDIAKAAPLALDAARSPDLELRDTATRALGKFVESIPPGQLPEEVRLAFLKVLQGNLADSSPGIRSKAVRSLGKLARYGHLTPEERHRLRVTFKRILGEDEHYEWDRAYVVRKEAQEALAAV